MDALGKSLAQRPRTRSPVAAVAAAIGLLVATGCARARAPDPSEAWSPEAAEHAARARARGSVALGDAGEDDRTSAPSCAASPVIAVVGATEYASPEAKAWGAAIGERVFEVGAAASDREIAAIDRALVALVFALDDRRVRALDRALILGHVGEHLESAGRCAHEPRLLQIGHTWIVEAQRWHNCVASQDEPTGAGQGGGDAACPQPHAGEIPLGVERWFGAASDHAPPGTTPPRRPAPRWQDHAQGRYLEIIAAHERAEIAQLDRAPFDVWLVRGEDLPEDHVVGEDVAREFSCALPCVVALPAGTSPGDREAARAHSGSAVPGERVARGVRWSRLSRAD